MNKILHDWVVSSSVQFGTSGARGLVSAMTAEVCYAYTQAFLRAIAPGADEVVLPGARQESCHLNHEANPIL